MDFIEFKKRFEHKTVIEEPNLVSSKPLVSVCVQTYQHANFIKECLDGILMQKTNFEFEILLGEDASNDGTREICIDYANRFHNKIRLFQHYRENNIAIGGIPTGRFNFLYNMYSARGKYIAMCEGDDYWTDPLKLQKQFDILEKHSEINICSHPSFKIINEELTDEKVGYWGDQIRHFSFEEVLINFAKTAPMQSIFIRNKKLDFFCMVSSKALGGHSMIQIYYSYANGLIYLPEVMSIYRVDSISSISKTLFKKDKGYLKRQLLNFPALDLIAETIDKKYQPFFEETKRRRAIRWIGASYTSSSQNIYLIYKYKLYKSMNPLARSLKFNYVFKLKRLAKKFKDEKNSSLGIL